MEGMEDMEVCFVEEVFETHEMDQSTLNPNIERLQHSQKWPEKNIIQIICRKQTNENNLVISGVFKTLIEHYWNADDTQLLHYLQNNLDSQNIAHGSCKWTLAYKACKKEKYDNSKNISESPRLTKCNKIFFI